MRTPPHKVIIGFGATVHGDAGKVTHLAVKWLDLRTNETDWLWDPEESLASGFNRANYEMIYPNDATADRRISGHVLRLLKLRAEGAVFTTWRCSTRKSIRRTSKEHIALAQESATQSICQRCVTLGWDRAFDLAGSKVMVGIDSLQQ